MTTIISTPTPSTTIVSSLVGPPGPQGPAGDPAVDSVFGRIGDVTAQDDDYNITQIDPSGATEDDVIVVESGRFKIKSLEIGGEVIATLSIVSGDIIQFNGTSWVNVPLDINGPIAVHAALTDGVHGLIDTGGGTLFLADDGTYKALSHPPDLVTSVFGRVGVITAVVGDYAIADITGLTTVGPPTDFLAADGTYKAIVHPPDAVSSVFGRAGTVIALNGDYDITDITGLVTAGPGTNFLADDGTYKTVTHPPDAVASVFGRTGTVIAVGGDYAIADITGLTTAGGGTDFLANDGTYKAISHPPDAVDSVFGRTGSVVAVNNDYALAEIDGLTDAGAGDSFLADDGVYKAVASRQIVAPSVADATTITQAFQTIFDFSPDTAFRNNNCLITIHYQAMNIGGPATWGAHFRSLIGLTVQQNSFASGVAQTVDSSERAAFSMTMEGIVSATGNIQIQAFAEIRDHDVANSAASGKTRLTIELV